MRDEIGLDERHGDDDKDGLNEEGEEEGAAAESADATHDD